MTYQIDDDALDDAQYALAEAQQLLSAQQRLIGLPEEDNTESLLRLAYVISDKIAAAQKILMPALPPGGAPETPAPHPVRRVEA
jgi:hypothetical protein